MTARRGGVAACKGGVAARRGGVAARGGVASRRGGVAAGRGGGSANGSEGPGGTDGAGGVGGFTTDIVASGGAGEDGTGTTAVADGLGSVKDRAFCSARPWQCLSLVIKHEMIGLTEYMCPKVHHRSLYCFKTGAIERGPFLRH